MPIRKVAKMGNPVLCNPAKTVEKYNAYLKNLVQDIKDTMTVANAIGITAPHIGIDLRIVIIGPQSNLPLMVFINPEIEPTTSEKESDWEGSISLPNIRAKVPRYKRIKYKAFDVEGLPMKGILENFSARVLQHEVDQINGIWFLQRIEDWKTCGFEDELTYIK